MEDLSEQPYVNKKKQKQNKNVSAELSRFLCKGNSSINVK